MIHTARQEFDQLLDSLHSRAESRSTAYQVERELFTRLLALGQLLLKVFFALCAQRSARRDAQQSVACEDGKDLRLHSYKSRRYVSIFGPVQIERPYFWRRGQAGQFPMDEALSLPDDSYSDLLREQADLLSGKMAYGEASAVIEELLGLSLSTSVLKRLVERDGGEVQACRSVPTEAVLGGGGSRGSGRREGRSDAPSFRAFGAGGAFPGTPGQRAETCEEKRGRGDESLHHWKAGTLGRGGARFIFQFSSRFSEGRSPKRGPPKQEGLGDPRRQRGRLRAPSRSGSRSRRPHVTDRVALSDGCKALQDRFREQLPRFELILDFVHVSEYLWKAANALFEEGLFEEAAEERLNWVIERSRELLTGGHEAVLARLRQASTRSDDACAQAARYFERNAERMDYARYLARGWPIATGVIEGACRHLVKDRCETSGMRWNVQGAEQVLALRAVWTDGDWDAYHRHRRQKRHRRLYGSPPPETTDTLEEQMWRMAA